MPAAPHSPLGPPSDPLRDLDRLREIADLGLTDPDAGALLQELAAEASRRLGLPTGMVSVVLDSAQLFVAHHGLDGWMAEAQGTPVEWSFCQHAVRDRDAVVIGDATADPRMKDSPLVTHEGVRCYAGIPLVSSRGHVVGTLCATGTEARSFTGEEIQALHDLAAEAVRRIEARRSESA